MYIPKRHNDAQFSETGDCPICGKRFIPAPFHGWYVDETLVCSYTCQAKGEREGWKRKKKRGLSKIPPETKLRAVELVLKEGYTYEAAGNKVGHSLASVCRWCRAYLNGEDF